MMGRPSERASMHSMDGDDDDDDCDGGGDDEHRCMWEEEEGGIPEGRGGGS